MPIQGTTQKPIEVDALVEHILPKIEAWRDYRDNNYKSHWDYAWRIWYGEHSAEDKERNSERSKYISPDTQSAIETAGAEIEEALFGREAWVDMGVPEVTEAVLDDFQSQTGNISEAILYGGIYGTGILKYVIRGSGLHPEKIVVAVEPYNFVIDPASNTIREAYGCAHEFLTPLHLIDKGISEGIYRPQIIGAWSENLGHPDTARHQLRHEADAAHIVEYHGLAPAGLIRKHARNRDIPDGFGDSSLIECVVTIANKFHVLRAEYTPYERPFSAFQYERNPNRFWGRGIPHRTKWTQRGMDTEIRARQDALALSTFPVTLTNAANMVRNQDMGIRPGRNIAINAIGPLSDSFDVLRLPPPDQQTYAHTAELSKKLELASGQLMNGMAMGQQDISRTGAGVASMFMGAQIRRTSRTIRNIENQMIKPFLANYVTRMSAIDPQRYSAIASNQIKVISGLGIMAREFEITRLSEVMGMMPDGPMKMLLARIILDASPMIEKSGVMALVDAVVEQALSSEEDGPTPADEVAVARLEFEREIYQQNFDLEQAKLKQKYDEMRLTHERDLIRIATEQDRIENDGIQKDSQALLNIAKAEAEEVGQQLKFYESVLNKIKVDNES